MEKQFEMTDDQFKAITDAAKPTPVMYLSGGKPMGFTPQENANFAWQQLGKELGFKWDTARPCSKGNKFFYADTID